MSRMDIDTLDVAGVRDLLDRAAAEGWNPGLADAAAFHAADPEGFLALRVDGAFAAGISVVRQDAAHGFLGLYIAAPECRGKGFGLALWKAALERSHARGLVSIGLDGVPEQQANYRRSGFAFVHRNLRYAGAPAALTGSVPRNDVEPREVSPSDTGALAALDAEAGGVEREAFLRHWLRSGAGRSSLMVLDERGGTSPTGFGTVRRCREGHKIGPLVARTPEIATRLLAALARRAADADDDGPLVVDVPEPNAAAVALLEAAGFERVFETARMYLGPAPEIDTTRLWGVGTLELG